MKPVVLMLLPWAVGGLASSGIGKGISYLLIAAALALTLWGLTRLKPQAPKRVRKKKR